MSDPDHSGIGESTGRAPTSGFTLLETLIAFAIMALIVGGLAGLFGWAATQQNMRLKRLVLAEFASSVLEEYAVTYPLMPSSGRDVDGWTWAVLEEPVIPDDVTALQAQIGYLRLTARVWRDTQPAFVVSASTLLATRTSP